MPIRQNSRRPCRLDSSLSASADIQRQQEDTAVIAITAAHCDSPRGHRLRACPSVAFWRHLDPQGLVPARIDLLAMAVEETGILQWPPPPQSPWPLQ